MSMFAKPSNQPLLYGLHVNGQWPGQSGQKYSYISCSPDGPFINAAAIYIFVGGGTLLTGPRPLYVGKSSDLGRRIDEHRLDPKWHQARSMGMRAIHVIFVQGEFERDVIEKDLIAGLRPPLNEVVPATLLGAAHTYLTGRL